MALVNKDPVCIISAMIAGIEGVLEDIHDGTALIRPAGGGLTYQVHLPAFAAARLGAALGSSIALSTLHFIESQGQGTTMTPRLAGFLTAQDRQFFELFTTCKGIGPRKALRAMALDVGQMAGAIADRDVALLQSLPEIGRRTAETIVATLHGKVNRFVTAQASSSPGQADAATRTSAALDGQMARQALDVLLQLGESRAQAISWIDQALGDRDHEPRDVQQLITAVYRLKAHA